MEWIFAKILLRVNGYKTRMSSSWHNPYMLVEGDVGKHMITLLCATIALQLRPSD